MANYKEYIVVVNEGVLISDVEIDLIRDTKLDSVVDSNVVPDRTCEVALEKSTNDRITHFYLTDAEAKNLKSDSRILDVHLKPTVCKSLMQTQTSNFSRTDTLRDDLVNWGLKRHIESVVDTNAVNDVYEVDYGYNLDGDGVDIIIQDDGIQTDHPEFQDEHGFSRVKEIDWYAESGMAGEMPSSFYSTTTADPNHNGGQHGTHVASVAAGKTYGWAKKARIYSMRIFGGPNHEIDYAESFDLIRMWHENKPVDPNTGVKRPTIVNQSWGFAYYYDNSPTANPSITNIFYKGVDQGYNGGESRKVSLGMVSPVHPISVPSVDVEQQQLTDAGVICIHSAGNSLHAQTSQYPEYNSDIYDSYYTREDIWAGMVMPNDPIYYNRAMSPNSRDTITVGGMSNEIQGTDELADRNSERGPLIDVWAAGSSIMAATSDTSNNVENVVYPDDNAYYISRLSGSSIATPQVSGMLCLLAQMHPSITPAQCKQFITTNSVSGILDTPSSEDWTDGNTNDSTYGSPDRILHWPYGSGINTVVEGNTETNFTNIT